MQWIIMKPLWEFLLQVAINDFFNLGVYHNSYTQYMIQLRWRELDYARNKLAQCKSWDDLQKTSLNMKGSILITEFDSFISHIKI